MISRITTSNPPPIYMLFSLSRARRCAFMAIDVSIRTLKATSVPPFPAAASLRVRTGPKQVSPASRPSGVRGTAEGVRTLVSGWTIGYTLNQWMRTFVRILPVAGCSPPARDGGDRRDHPGFETR